MKILLTGGDGFIGRHVSGLLKRASHDVETIDLKRGLDLATCKLSPCDVIIHLAAEPDVFACQNDPVMNLNSNVGLTARVVKHASETGANLVFASSAAVYGSGDMVPTSEYGQAKLLSEMIIRWNLANFMILRFFNVWHEDQTTGLMGAINKATKFQSQFFINGDGEQTRDFVHVDTVAQAVVRAMSITGETVDICTGEPVTVNQFIKDRNRDLELIHSEANDFEIRHSKGDPTKAKKLNLI